MPSMIDPLHNLAQGTAAVLSNSLLGGIAVALLAWAVTWRFDRKGSSTRFAVWFSALVAVVVFPLVGWMVGSQTPAASGPVHPSVNLPASWATYLVLGWIIGAALGLMRIRFGLYRLDRLRSTCQAVNLDEVDETLRASLADFQTHRPVILCSSDAVRVPAALGYFRPIVVFPTWALDEISPAQLNAILLHELAHLRRWDDWTNLVQQIVKAVFFFHPAVWFIEGRLSLEREMACDDVVLASNFSPRAYAESLVDLAEKSFLRRGVQLAQAAVSHVRQLKMRLAQILRGDRYQGVGVSKPAIAIMAFAAVVVLCGVSRTPRLVTFESLDAQIASAAIIPNKVSLSQESQLQPITLSLVDHARQPNPTKPVSSGARPRATHYIPFKPSVRLAQRTMRHESAERGVTPTPTIVLSNFRMQQSTAVPSAVLVVMQRAQFEVDGPIFWRVAVIHLTQAQQQAISRGVSRKI